MVMDVEHEVRLRHSPSRKGWPLLASFLCATCFIAPLKLGVADNAKQTNTGLSEIKGVVATDWVEYSPDATKIAIVHTKQSQESIPFGVSLQVYSVDSTLQPSQLLFEDESGFITEFQWVRKHLVYLTVNTNNSTEFPLTKWLSATFAQQGWEGVANHTEVKMWPNDLARSSNLFSVKLIPPGKLFSSGMSDTLLVFDVFQDVMRHWDKEKNRFTETSLSEHSIRTFQIPSGTLRDKVIANMPMPAFRWPFTGKGLVPLFLSPDNNKLIAIADINGSWSTTQSGPPAIISINIATGKMDTITSDRWLNSLHLPNGSDPQYFARGNPVPTKGGEQVVCALSMSDTPADMAFRFAFYDLKGEKAKEVFVFDKDLKQADVPAGLLLTWTPDGTQMLVQEGDIWAYDWQKKTSIKISQTVWVEDVIGWVDDRHLLVRAVSPDKTSKVPLTDRFIKSHKEWALLSLPEHPIAAQDN